MKAFLKKFFSGVKEWFSDAADYYQLWVLESKIDLLNEELDWEVNLNDRYEIGILLDLYCRAHNEILFRVRARDDRHQFSGQAVTR